MDKDLSKIENLLNNLKKDNLDISLVIKKFSEGKKLVKKCENKLEKYEKEVLSPKYSKKDNMSLNEIFDSLPKLLEELESDISIEEKLKIYNQCVGIIDLGKKMVERSELKIVKINSI